MTGNRLACSQSYAFLTVTDEHINPEPQLHVSQHWSVLSSHPLHRTDTDGLATLRLSVLS